MLARQPAKLRHKVVANLLYMLQQAPPLHLVDDGDSNRACQRPSTKCRAMHARRNCRCRVLIAKHRADRQAASKRLRDGRDIRHDAELLIAEPFASATKAALNLICNQQRAG